MPKTVMSLPYQGGKRNMIDHILLRIPKHKVYCELFGGMGWVLLNKPQSKVEVYNDLFEVVYNLFCVLQDKEARKELFERLEYTPFSRSLFRDWVNYCIENKPNIPDVLNAYSWIIRIYMSIRCVGTYNTKLKENRFYVSKKINRCKYWHNSKSNLNTIAKRFEQVSLENNSYEKIISIYDSEDTFFYADPPYFIDRKSRTSNGRYFHEFEEKDHITLFEKLGSIQGKVMISYYDCEFIRKLYKGWNIERFNVQKGSSDDGTGKSPEVLIMNYDSGLSLF